MCEVCADHLAKLRLFLDAAFEGEVGTVILSFLGEHKAGETIEFKGKKVIWLNRIHRWHYMVFCFVDGV